MHLAGCIVIFSFPLVVMLVGMLEPATPINSTPCGGRISATGTGWELGGWFIGGTAEWWDGVKRRDPRSGLSPIEVHGSPGSQKVHGSLDL